MYCKEFLKISLLVYNTLLLICSILLLASGLWLEYELHTMVKFKNRYYNKMSKATMGLGLSTIIISSWAFSFIKKEKTGLVFFYAGLLMCQVMIHCGVGASVIYASQDIWKGLYDDLVWVITHYKPECPYLRILQSQMGCCGANNYTDWINLSPQRVIPLSCCIDPFDCITANYNDVFQKGCYETIVETFRKNITLILLLASIVTVYPGLGCILGYFYGNQITAKNIRDRKCQQQQENENQVSTDFNNI